MDDVSFLDADQVFVSGVLSDPADPGPDPDVGGNVFASLRDASGVESWRVVAPGYGVLVSSAVSRSGESVLVGGFLGGLTLGGASFVDRVSFFGFAAGLSSDGDVAWAFDVGDRDVEPSFPPQGSILTEAAAADGRWVVVGNVFGNSVLAGEQLPAGSLGLMASVSTIGEIEWFRTYPDLSMRGLTALPDGSLLVTGRVLRSHVTIGEETLDNEGNGLFLHAASGDGAPLWTSIINGYAEPPAHALAVTTDGAIHVGARVDGTLAFPDGSGIETENEDGLVVSFASDGTFQRALLLPGPGDAGVTALCAAGTGVAVAASFSGDLVLGDLVLGDLVLSSTGADDIMFALVDASGVFVHVEPVGGSDGDGATGIVLDENGRGWLVGFFHDSLHAPDVDLVGQGSGDGFMLRLDASRKF